MPQQGRAALEPLQVFQQAQHTGGSVPGLSSRHAEGLLSDITSLEHELLAGSGVSEQHLQARGRSQAQDRATAASSQTAMASGPGLVSLEPQCTRMDQGVAAADLALQGSAELSAGQV